MSKSENSNRPGSGARSSIKAPTKRSAIPDPISEGLKRVYDATLHEPLPKRLSELLEHLKTGTA